MDLHKIDWNTVGPDMFLRLKEELGSEVINYCISLYGRDYSNEEIAKIVDKLKSDSNED
jgi:hypothetical protein